MTTFNALMRFPVAAYFDFNTAISTLKTLKVDAITLDGEQYNANMTVAKDEIGDLLVLHTELPGCIMHDYTVLAGSTAKPRKVVKHAVQKKLKVKKLYERATKKFKPRGGVNLHKLLSKWQSSEQLVKATGWSKSTVGARISQLRKKGQIAQQTGKDGFLQYKIAGVAA